MATNLRGVMAALLTPFDQQQALDKASLRRPVQFNIQQGIDGLYVGGSTGEAFVQSLSEREQVLEIVAEEAKGKIKLIAHVGCVSTAESRSLRHQPNVMALMPSPPLRRFTILSALKNTAITTGQSLTRRMVCRWWCTTFRR